MSEKLPDEIWSQQSYDEELRSNSPNRANPVHFDIEDAVRSIRFSQVPGETLDGAVTGYYLNEEGEKINLVTLDGDSRGKSGFQGDEMHVPEWAIDRPEARQTFETEPKALLAHDLGGQALEAVHIVRPEVEPYNLDALENQKITPELLKQLKENREARMEAAAENPEQSVERTKNPVLESIFAPITRPEIPSDTVEGDSGRKYDYLFGTDEERAVGLAAVQARSLANEPIRKEQAEYDRYINDDTRRIASDQLKYAILRDPTLKGILEDHSFIESSLEAVDALRTDVELRYDVGVYLLNKMNRAVSDNPSSYGDRLVRNGNKRNDYHGMGVSQMTSRQYASYLALSMLDGSFNGDRQSADDSVRHDPSGKVINSQHRDAARSII